MADGAGVRLAEATLALLQAIERGECQPSDDELEALRGLLIDAGRLPLAVKVQKLIRARQSVRLRRSP